MFPFLLPILKLLQDWIYIDDISLDYAFAQSVLFKIYGGYIQETGHKTKGHVCLTERDKEAGVTGKSSKM